MRVAQLMAGAPTGGAELFYERLCAALAGSGDEILPVIRHDAGRSSRLRAMGLHPVCLGFGGGADIWTRWRAGRALRRFAPRVAVAWMGRAARHTPSGPWVLVGRLGGYYDLRRFAHCDHLAGNTPAMVDWIRAQGFPAERVHLLPNFSPDLAGAAPATLPVPQGVPVVLAMGRLHRNKGFDILIAAMSRLPGIHAVIAGEGPERVGLQRLATHAGLASRVHFLGWRSDTASLLSACDLLVCPSRSEPLGNVVLEAFSARRPVVAAMAEGPRALIESGRNGILVAPESAIALAAGIDGVLRCRVQADQMVQSARHNFETEYAQAPVLARWREFLSKIEKPTTKDTA